MKILKQVRALVDRADEIGYETAETLRAVRVAAITVTSTVFIGGVYLTLKIMDRRG